MIKAIAICGPTASGKTAISLALAERLGAEIISCDSMQIYRGMDIGTAKATKDEMARVPHHLVDFLSPLENYSTEQYRSAALLLADEINKRGKIPLFVGGTGLYIDTLLRGENTAVPESDEAFRAKILENVKTEEDAIRLWERLRDCDPESSEKIHPNNVRRVIRAIEIFEKTGKPKSYFDKLSKEKPRDIEILMITFDFHSRETLYKKIDERVDKMIEDGLYDEVEGLYKAGLLRESTTAAQAIGYKEIVSAIKGEVTLTEAKEAIKLATRRYAKRQLTWFRHTDSFRIMMDNEKGELRSGEEVLSEISEIIKYNF